MGKTKSGIASDPASAVQNMRDPIRGYVLSEGFSQLAEGSQPTTCCPWISCTVTPKECASSRKDIWISQSISSGDPGGLWWRDRYNGHAGDTSGRPGKPAEGSSFDEILKGYPSLSEYQLRAVVAFAAATAKEDLPLLPGPTLE